jgi:hypothetical protein
VTIQHDPFISEILAGHVPERREIAPDWKNVLHRAGVREPRRLKLSRRSVVIAFAAILVAMIGSALALSAENDWWFLHGGGGVPIPAGEVVVVTTETWDGHNWNLAAFRTSDLNEREGLCSALTPGQAPGSQGLGASMGCGPLPRSSSTHPDKISFVWAEGPGPDGFPPHAFGPVVGEATKVRLELAGGETIETKTIPAPAELGLPIRFFAAMLPECADLARIVALDNGGNIVGEYTLPHPRFRPTQGCN